MSRRNTTRDLIVPMVAILLIGCALGAFLWLVERLARHQGWAA